MPIVGFLNVSREVKFFWIFVPPWRDSTCFCRDFLDILIYIMKEDLAHIRENALQAIAKADTPEAVEDLRIRYLGRKSALISVLRSLKDLSPEDRKLIGVQAQALQKEITDLLDERTGAIRSTLQESVFEKEWVDVTRPGARIEKGHLHPLTKITREMVAIFSAMGFEIVDGPEVETEYYNFDALNIPASHPAREMWDTFWLKERQKIAGAKSQRGRHDRLLLRTHTSPVQIRYMESHNPPIRIIIPGRVYR